MCTLSFIPTNDGYVVAMNRDEKLSRPAASAPIVQEIDGVQAMYPLDVEGGTWIAASASGTTWALLNRNTNLKRRPRSRGEIILSALRSNDVSSEQLDLKLLNQVLPFRLIRFCLISRNVLEWVWDGHRCTSIAHPWQTNHWFSSGESDELASAIRSKTVGEFQGIDGRESMEWLRKLHRSHKPERGAFSICVHRADARTVSYTEISVSNERVSMNYVDGSPCESDVPTRLEIPRYATSNL
jgi:hypothetical protein